jgi:hypothetical protein
MLRRDGSWTVTVVTKFIFKIQQSSLLLSCLTLKRWYILSSSETSVTTRWFKYDRDYLCVNISQFVPVLFEPPCINHSNRRNISEEFRLHQHRCENLKRRTLDYVPVRQHPHPHALQFTVNKRCLQQENTVFLNHWDFNEQKAPASVISTRQKHHCWCII